MVTLSNTSGDRITCTLSRDKVSSMLIYLTDTSTGNVYRGMNISGSSVVTNLRLYEGMIENFLNGNKEYTLSL